MPGVASSCNWALIFWVFTSLVFTCSPFLILRIFVNIKTNILIETVCVFFAQIHPHTLLKCHVSMPARGRKKKINAHLAEYDEIMTAYRSFRRLKAFWKANKILFHFSAALLPCAVFLFRAVLGLGELWHWITAHNLMERKSYWQQLLMCTSQLNMLEFMGTWRVSRLVLGCFLTGFYWESNGTHPGIKNNQRAFVQVCC